MSALPTVVAREYLTRVRSRTFLIGTLAAPLLFVGVVALSAWLGTLGADDEFRVGLVDRTGALERGLVPRLEELGLQVESLVGEEPEGSLREGVPPLDRVERGELRGILEVDEETSRSGRAIWWGTEAPSVLRRVTIQQAVGQTVLEERFQGEADAGMMALLGGGSLETVLLGEDPDGEAEVAGVLLGVAGAFLLYFALLVYGAMVLRSVLEEKTGRIVEVILSSVRPWELMLGKILGVGAVGLTQLLVWVLFGAAVLALGAAAVLPAVAEAGLLERAPDFLPGPGLVGFFLICFVLGYFIYASIFAAVGAMCSTEEEAQQLQLPIVMLVLVPFLFLLPVMEDPESTLATVLSLIPLFSPILMFARVAVDAAPLWQAVLSVVGMVLALAGVGWVAGRVYRAGILMQGKRPTLPELWRWVRAG
jgi:ABC-2 type transport system permease protein